MNDEYENRLYEWLCNTSLNLLTASNTNSKFRKIMFDNFAYYAKKLSEFDDRASFETFIHGELIDTINRGRIGYFEDIGIELLVLNLIYLALVEPKEGFKDVKPPVEME